MPARKQARATMTQPGARSGAAGSRGARIGGAPAPASAQRATQLPALAVGGVSRALAGALATGRIGHAYLLVALSQGLPAHEDGHSMATAAALSFARRLNCECPVGDIACGKCLSCRLVDDGNHPDVRIVAPDGLSIKIDQVREVKKDMSFKPRRAGGFRVTIVENAERMTLEAQNSLLKLLEEPPENTVFLLVTANPSGLLPTVRSRCQFIRVCGGETRTQERFWEFLGLVRRARTLSPLDVLMEAEAVERRLHAGEAADQPRRQLEAALVAAVMWYRDVLVFKTTGDAQLACAADPSQLACATTDAAISGNRMLELERDARSYETDEIICIIDRIEEARRQVRKNANTRLVLEAMLFALRAKKGRALREDRRAGLVK
ncbi:MAG: hypothetical protein AB1774_03995 [Bacillota bacterium]